MFNIRRKLLPGAVCLCMAVMVCSCQNLPHGERPYDYPPAKWVSESGDLWFEVTEDTMAREKKERMDQYENTYLAGCRCSEPKGWPSG